MSDNISFFSKKQKKKNQQNKINKSIIKGLKSTKALPGWQGRGARRGGWWREVCKECK
jgi:hypothetical protein